MPQLKKVVDKDDILDDADDTPDFLKSNVISQMPEETRKEIQDTNMAALKLQNRLSAISIGSPDLALTHQASSMLSVTSPPSNSRFFIIKSYTEEDIHKAVKYGVWSSTAQGNMILDAAYKDIEQFRRDNENKEAELYLFFSVNKSKHF